MKRDPSTMNAETEYIHASRPENRRRPGMIVMRAFLPGLLLLAAALAALAVSFVGEGAPHTAQAQQEQSVCGVVNKVTNDVTVSTQVIPGVGSRESSREHEHASIRGTFGEDCISASNRYARYYSFTVPESGSIPNDGFMGFTLVSPTAALYPNFNNGSPVDVKLKVLEGSGVDGRVLHENDDTLNVNEGRSLNQHYPYNRPGNNLLETDSYLYQKLEAGTYTLEVTTSEDRDQAEGGSLAVGKKFYLWIDYLPSQSQQPTTTTTPTPTPDPEDFVHISAGAYHTCGLKANGEVVCWGANSYQQSVSPAGVAFKYVDAGIRATCGVKIDGEVVCWGHKHTGGSPPPGLTDVEQVSSWWYHSCAVKTNGEVVCWGYNGDCEWVVVDDQVTLCKFVPPIPPSGSDFTSVSVGDWQGCAISTNGEVSCWGQGRWGQGSDSYDTLERHRHLDDRSRPPTPPPGNYKQVSVGPAIVCVLKSDGEVSCQSRLDSDLRTKPPPGPFTQISAGGNGSGVACGLRTGGEIACWGRNTDNLLNPPSGTFKQVSVGTRHACGLRAGGEVVCWGSNSLGQATPLEQSPKPNRPPTVARALPDATIAGERGTLDVSLSGVFSDADNDNLNISVYSSNDSVATVTVASDQSRLRVRAHSRGYSNIVVFANDGYVNSEASHYFVLTVTAAQKQAPTQSLMERCASHLPSNAISVSEVTGWRDAYWRDASHVRRWNRVLEALGEDTGTGVSPFTVAESKANELLFMRTRWSRVTGTLEGLRTCSTGQQQASTQPLMERCASHLPSNAISVSEVIGWRDAHSRDASHVLRWNRVLEALGEYIGTSVSPLTVDESKANELFYTRARWSRVTATLEGIAACIAADPIPETTNDSPPQQPANRAPTVASAIADATIVNESGTKQVSLSGTFSDADSDGLTITAASSNENVATVSVAADYSSLTVSAQARGTATITVTADDGNGGTVSDDFAVTVKAAPTVALNLTGVSGVEAGSSRNVSLSGVFSDADGDTLSITASSDDENVATVTAAADGSAVTVTGVSAGEATITVTAWDTDGNGITDYFAVTVTAAQQQESEQQANTQPLMERCASHLPANAISVSEVTGWRDAHSHDASHVLRWNRVLEALGEDTGTGVAPFTVDESKANELLFMRTRWSRVTGTLEGIRTCTNPPQQPGNRAPTVSSAIADATIVNERGTSQLSLSGVFSDADNDSLTITAASSNENVATVSVLSDQSRLTVSAQARGTAAITVTANDGNGGTVEDAFTVTVKAAPTVALNLTGVSGLEVGSSRSVSLSGVFSDADGDALSIAASSDDENVATVTVATDGSALTIAGVSAGEATITVVAQDTDGNRVSNDFAVTVTAPQQQLPANRAPAVSNAIADATIVNESGTRRVSLSGVFSDADNDSLTIAAASSNQNVATVSVSSDYSTLTVSARSRGTSTITVTADDGEGGTVSDDFTVTVKAAPTVASVIADVTGLTEGSTRDVSLSGVFSDADGDALTISAASSNNAVAAVTVAANQSTLTVEGMLEGTAIITVTAEDSDGNRVSDAFDVSVSAPPPPQQQAPTTAQDTTTTSETEGDTDAETSSVVARYDTNGNGKIDPSEYWQATEDYNNGKITLAEAMEVALASGAFSG